MDVLRIDMTMFDSLPDAEARTRLNRLHTTTCVSAPCDQPTPTHKRCQHYSDCAKAAFTCRAYRDWAQLRKYQLSERTPDD